MRHLSSCLCCVFGVRAFLTVRLGAVRRIEVRRQPRRWYEYFDRVLFYNSFFATNQDSRFRPGPRPRELTSSILYCVLICIWRWSCITRELNGFTYSTASLSSPSCSHSSRYMTQHSSRSRSTTSQSSPNCVSDSAARKTNSMDSSSCQRKRQHKQQSNVRATIRGNKKEWPNSSQWRTLINRPRLKKWIEQST